MAGSVHPDSIDGSGQGVVQIELPKGREFAWLSANASARGWEKGDEVSYKGSRWRVVSRSDEGNVLTLVLAAAGS